MKLFCKICNCNVENFTHFFHIHRLKYKNYYDKYLKSENDGKCKICGKDTYWDPTKHCYCKYCSPTCRNLDPEWMILRNNTMIEKYGILTTPASEDKMKNYREKCAKNSVNKLAKLFIDGYIISYDYNTKLIKYHCNKCNNTYSEKIAVFRHRLYISKITGCQNCLKEFRHNGESRIEEDVLNYIKSIYNGIIIQHAKNILTETRMELDFYFPELNKAIEFDGTYWHADKRFYKANDLIECKRTKAKIIWKRDKKKDKICEDLNISLFRIKEYDWTYNIEDVKNQIKIFLLN